MPLVNFLVVYVLLVLPSLSYGRYVLTPGASPQKYIQNEDAEYEIPIVRQSSVNNGDGFYSYSYETSDGKKVEESSSGFGPNQVVHGSFSYIGPEGRHYSLTYTADEDGFHPIADYLPTPPPIPEAILRSLQNAPPSGAYPSDSVVVEANRKSSIGTYHQNRNIGIYH